MPGEKEQTETEHCPHRFQHVYCHGGKKQTKWKRCNIWIGGTRKEGVVIHLFADASEDAYGCCICLATDSSSELVYAKANVVPLNARTLPRLELLVRCIRSDNATVFVAAAKILRVEWIFNPSATPWF